MAFTDAHCHLADPRYDLTLDKILVKSREVEVIRWFLGGTSPDDWARQVTLKQAFGKQVLMSFGIHPWFVTSKSESELIELNSLIKQHRPDLSALGELGLDFSSRFSKDSHTLQTRIFEAQLRIARDWKLPLILHIVNAHREALEILESFAPYPYGGLVHSFSSSIQNAQRYRSLGFTLSLSGAVARPGFETLKKTVKFLNEEDFVVETDSPDQASSQDREAGRLNEPSKLWDVAEAIAVLRNAPSARSILEISEKNLERILSK